MTTDYGAWAANAKAQAVEDRLNQLTANNSAAYLIVSTFANGWSANASIGIKKIDQNTAVRITGVLNGGTTASGTAVMYLTADSSYYPGRKEMTMVGISGGSWGTGAPYLEIGIDGWVVCQGSANFSGGLWHIDGTYPLDTS